MLPINTISTYILQPPIVNTTTPGTTVNHVPYDNVAPSVSSPQVDNNARGNSEPPPAAPDPASSATANSAAEEGISTGASSNGLSLSTQASFLAQLAGQDLSPETQGVLIQYEKLLAISDVKYKPSNAFKPPAEPASLFGKILQSERQAPPEPVTQSAPASSATVSQNASAAGSPLVIDARPALRNNAKTAPASSASNDNSAIDTQARVAVAEPPVFQQQGISAYAQSATRVAVQIPTGHTEAITQLA